MNSGSVFWHNINNSGEALLDFRYWWDLQFVFTYDEEDILFPFLMHVYRYTAYTGI